MLSGFDIVCFAPNDWWAMNPSCTTHIMQKLAGKNRVLYVNPFSSDLLGSVKSKRKLGPLVTRKLKSIARCLKRPEKTLYIFSPVFIPVQGRKIIDVVNNFMLKLQIKMVCWLIGMTNPIVWLENIRAANMMDCFGPGVKVYHVSDLFTNDLYAANSSLQYHREKQISDDSDLLICVSKELYKQKQSQRDNVFYIPHGVDFDLFQEASRKGERLEELVDVSRPVAGYFGTMTTHNDIELLLWCACNLPDVSFVFAGQITSGDYSALGKLNNVYFLGRMPYEKIPWLCAVF